MVAHERHPALVGIWRPVRLPAYRFALGVIPVAGTGNDYSRIGLQAETRDLFFWILTIALLDHGKNAGSSNESADNKQIFHLSDSFPVRC